MPAVTGITVATRFAARKTVKVAPGELVTEPLLIPERGSLMVTQSRIVQSAKTTFSWKDGDVLLPDKMTMPDGRQSYGDSRKVRVAMVEPCSNPKHTR